MVSLGKEDIKDGSRKDILGNQYSFPFQRKDESLASSNLYLTSEGIQTRSSIPAKSVFLEGAFACTNE